MKTTTSFSTILATMSLAASILFTSCSKDEITLVAPKEYKNHIAYIFNNDSSDAVAFKSLLGDNGCDVVLINKSKAATTDYNNYQLIVVDHNTDAAGMGGWTKSDAEAVRGTNKPLLLMGMGGLMFSSQIENDANWENTTQINDDSFAVLDNSSKLLKKPYAIELAKSTQTITLYKAPTMGAGQALPGTYLNNNILIGNFTTDNAHYPITFERQQYMIFGFYKGVSNMTTNGRNFMVNLCYYVGKLTM